MKLYIVQCSVRTGSVTRQLPTFLLDADLLGLVSENHAENVAIHMLMQVNPIAQVYASAVLAEYERA